MSKKACIIGAGFSGISAANVFKQYGFEVQVYEKEKEAGGVWASCRRYPGLGTQNTRDTYHLSDLAPLNHHPEWPRGEQIQEYFEAYINQQKLRSLIKFNTSVISTKQESDDTWVVESKSSNGVIHSEKFDYLIICNGIFSTPSIPNYEGTEDFINAGGRVCHTSEFTNKEDAKDKNIIVVGFGKSSCDVANAIAPITNKLTQVARSVVWKLPKFVFGVNFKYLFLTRMGENLMKYKTLSGFAKFLHGPGLGVRNFLLNRVEGFVGRKLNLKKLPKLQPEKSFEAIATSNISLYTDGHFDKIRSGEIAFEKSEITKLEPKKAHLKNGQIIDTDIIICGTGWQQVVPFMEERLQKKLYDENGDYLLYKNQIPIGIKNMSFNGYHSSFFCPTSSEIGALWIAEYFTKGFTLPIDDKLRKDTDERLAWSKERTNGKNSRGTNIIPFTFHHIDDLCEDMGTNLSTFERFNQWNLPPSPLAYNKIIKSKIKIFKDKRAKDYFAS